MNAQTTSAPKSRIYLDDKLSKTYDVPYLKNQGRTTVVHTDSLKRFNHPEAGDFPAGDLQLEGAGLPGWWTVTTAKPVQRP